MRSAPVRTGAVLCGLLLAALPLARGGEVVEDIIAWINGEIITRSDYEAEQQMMIADAYRRLEGPRLEQEVKVIREGLLLEMIDRKILVHYAKGLGYDLDKMQETIYQQFKEQQQIKSDKDLEALLAQDGMSLRQLKTRLVEQYAPKEVIRFQVGGRLAISDREIEAYYQQHPEEFTVQAEATLREIVLLADTEEKRKARRAEADGLRQRLIAGEDFAAVAAQHSEAGTREAGGLLGTHTPGELSDQLNAAAFNLPVGSISEVLDTPYGFHLLKVESRIERQLRPLDEVRAVVKRMLEDQKYGNELRAFLDKARGEAEWCVKPAYQQWLSVPSPDCETL